jgi:hypothetical protein
MISALTKITNTSGLWGNIRGGDTRSAVASTMPEAAVLTTKGEH